MMHESITQKEFVVKEHEGFRLRVRTHEVISPKGLYSFDFIQESLKDGEVQGTATYNFFLTKEEIKTLSDGLLSV